jgi:AcrR family transcriptional regulator
LATLELLVAGVLIATKSGLRGEGSLEGRAEEGLAIFTGLLVAQPDAARLCVIEAEPAGPRAAAMIDRAAAEFAEIMAEVFEELPEQRGMPAELVTAMVGGVRKMPQTRLLRGTEEELLGLVGDLVSLGLSYRPPPGPLRARRARWSTSAPEDRRGIDEPAERLERAAMRVIAEIGYTEATMAEVASEAGASLRTLHGSFGDKARVFEAVLLRSRLRTAATTLPAFRRGSEWAERITMVVRASLGFLEVDPDFARLITMQVHAAGAAALESRERALEAGQRMIEAAPGYEELGNPIAAEATMGSAYSLAAARVRSGKGTDLKGLAPVIVYLILAPFLGAEEAYRHAIS